MQCVASIFQGSHIHTEKNVHKTKKVVVTYSQNIVCNIIILYVDAGRDHMKKTPQKLRSILALTGVYTV